MEERAKAHPVVQQCLPYARLVWLFGEPSLNPEDVEEEAGAGGVRCAICDGRHHDDGVQLLRDCPNEQVRRVVDTASGKLGTGRELWVVVTAGKGDRTWEGAEKLLLNWRIVVEALWKVWKIRLAKRGEQPVAD